MNVEAVVERMKASGLPVRADAHRVIRVGNTRVGLDSVIIAFQQGATPEQIADDFPVLSLDDIKAIISYYLQNREIIDAYLVELAKIGERNRIRWESDPETQALRHKLRERILNRTG
jgi:uncharacterized protein (DUF433 family)